MGMKNISNLGYILKCLNISAKALSDYLHVDRTLVSKWKNGARKLNPETAYFQDMCHYFLKRNEGLNAKTLESLFACEYPQEQLKDLQFLKQCLEAFLLEASPVTQANYQKFLPPKAIETSLFQYRGDSGFYQAFLDFLDETIKSSFTQILYLFDAQNYSWVSEDSNYMGQVLERFKKLADKQIEVHIIYTSAEITLGFAQFRLKCWSIFFEDNFHEHFMSWFNVVISRNSIFISVKQLVLHSFALSDDKVERYTSIYIDEMALEYHNNLIQFVLSTAKSLEVKYDSKQFKIFIDENKFYKSRMEDVYIISALPRYNMMSKALLKEILEDNNTSLEQCEKSADLYNQISYYEHKVTDKTIKTLFLYLPCIKTALTLERVPYYCISLLANKEITISNACFRKHLKELVGLLESRKNVQIVLCPEKSYIFDYNCSFICKRSTWLYSVQNKYISSIKFSTEPTLVDGFCQFINYHYDFIPSEYTERNSVIHLLNDLIKRV